MKTQRRKLPRCAGPLSESLAEPYVGLEPEPWSAALASARPLGWARGAARKRDMMMGSNMHHSTTPALSPSPQIGNTPPCRSFAGMTPEQHRAMASAGGKKSHALKRAHEFSSEEARHAGRLGGIAVSKDREHMAAIGRKGGSARKTRKRSPRAQGQPQQSQKISVANPSCARPKFSRAGQTPSPSLGA